MAQNLMKNWIKFKKSENFWGNFGNFEVIFGSFKEIENE